MEYKDNCPLSVIVPVYNMERWLERAIRSLLAQTLEGMEIILVDDGSTDGSGGMIDRAAEENGNIIALHRANGGLSEARNTGISAARGRYIGFLDPDDYADKNMYDLLYHAAAAADADLTVCGYEEHFSPAQSQLRQPAPNGALAEREGLIRAFLAGSFGAYAWNKLFRRDIIEKYDLKFPVGIQVVEDGVFLCAYLSHVRRVSILPQCCYHYVRNSNSICAKYHTQQFDYYRAGYEAKKELIRSMPLQQQAELTGINETAYLRTCLNMLDQLNALGNRTGWKQRYRDVIAIGEDPELNRLIRCRAGELKDDRQRKKCAWISRRRWKRLFAYELWKMRIWGRIRYYLS